MIEYKCPCCGGGVEFNASLQKLKCPYCETEFDMDAVEALEEENQKEDNQFDFNLDAGQEWGEDEQNGMSIYTCNSCGGQIIGDDTMGASKCPYCDNPIVLTGQFSGELKPDCIIPFKINKETAKGIFKKHLEDKKLLPKEFRDYNRIEEIKGLYVPFWLFDTKVGAVVNYRCTKLGRKWSKGDYDYTEYLHYAVKRVGDVTFEHIPVDGSSKMPNDMMESLEPYYFNEIVDFKTVYMAGYCADKYDVNVEDSIGCLTDRVTKTTERVMSDTVRGYMTVSPVNSSIQVKESTSKYALLPVWVMTVLWNQERYIVAVNGQTGKFVGNLPVGKQEEKALFRKWFRILGLGLGALAAVLTIIF